jgi:hypothetical protein
MVDTRFKASSVFDNSNPGIVEFKSCRGHGSVSAFVLSYVGSSYAVNRSPVQVLPRFIFSKIILNGNVIESLILRGQKAFQLSLEIIIITIKLNYKQRIFC